MTAPSIGGGHFPNDPGTGKVWGSDGAGNALAKTNVGIGDILLAGFGYKAWNFNPNNGSGGTAPTAGTVYCTGLGLRAGTVITNMLWAPTTGGSGTVPTDIFVGICDSTGKMLVQSATQKSLSAWTSSATVASVPLANTYTVTADGLYYGVFLQVGSWSVTQLALAKNVSSAWPGGIGGLSTLAFGTGGTVTQTALPVNGSSIVGGIVVTNAINYFCGVN